MPVISYLAATICKLFMVLLQWRCPKDLEIFSLVPKWAHTGCFIPYSSPAIRDTLANTCLSSYMHCMCDVRISDSSHAHHGYILMHFRSCQGLGMDGIFAFFTNLDCRNEMPCALGHYLLHNNFSSLPCTIVVAIIGTSAISLSILCTKLHRRSWFTC